MSFLWNVLNIFRRSRVRTVQPSDNYQFKNSFGPVNSENIIKIYECREGCSECCGPKTTIALTSNRLMSRKRQYKYCFGCIKGPHIDKTIFLRDIQGITKTRLKISWLTIFITCIIGAWPFLLLYLCFYPCCCNRLERLIIKGGFGSEILTFKKSEVSSAAIDISTMILPFKKPISKDYNILQETFWSLFTILLSAYLYHYHYSY